MMANVSQFFHFKSPPASSLHPAYSYFSLVPSPRDLGTALKNQPHLTTYTKRRVELTLIEITGMNQLMREDRTDRLGQEIHTLPPNITRVQLAECRLLIDSSVVSVTEHNDIFAQGCIRSSLNNIAGTLIRSRRRVISHIRIPSILVSVHARGDLLQMTISTNDGEIIHGFRIVTWDLGCWTERICSNSLAGMSFSQSIKMNSLAMASYAVALWSPKKSSRMLRLPWSLQVSYID